MVAHTQGKLVRVIKGSVYDVAVDLREGSPTYGQYYGVELTEENKKQFYISEGFAHGFHVLSETASVVYQCSDYYHPGDEYGLNWASKRLGIDWAVKTPVLSGKDAALPMFEDVAESDLPA